MRQWILVIAEHFVMLRNTHTADLQGAADQRWQEKVDILIILVYCLK